MALGLVLAGCGTASNEASSTPTIGTGTGTASPFLAGNLATVSCGVGTICAAGGTSFNPNAKNSVLVSSVDGGVRWRQATRPVQPGATFSDVACAAIACLAVGSLGNQPLLLRASERGVAFTAAPEPSAGIIEAVACAGPTHCMGIAASGTTLQAVTSTTAGASWATSGLLPSSAGRVIHLSCTTPERCISAGIDQNGGAQVLATTDGGGTWTPLTLPKKVTTVLQASCRSNGSCLIVTRKDGGATPLLLERTSAAVDVAKIPLPGDIATPVGVTCTATTCVVVGGGSAGQGAASVLGTTGWRTLSLHYAPTTLVDVSCASASSCTAIGTGSLVQLSP